MSSEPGQTNPDVMTIARWRLHAPPRRRTFAVTLLVLLVALGAGALFLIAGAKGNAPSAATSTGVGATIGQPAPDFSLVDAGNGQIVRLSSLKGRPVWLNFWATWCPPCRAEIPVIAQLYNETKTPGAQSTSRYEILGVATNSDPSTIKAFTAEFNMSFPILPDNDGLTTSAYHVLPIPTSFFIDKEGIIRYVQTGMVDRPLMEKWLLNK